MDKRQEIIEREKSKPGLRGHINAMCVDCLYDPVGGKGTWKQQVAACTSYRCPLHDVRPLPEEAGGKAKMRVEFSIKQAELVFDHRGGEKSGNGAAHQAEKA